MLKKIILFILLVSLSMGLFSCNNLEISTSAEHNVAEIIGFVRDYPVYKLTDPYSGNTLYLCSGYQITVVPGK